MKRIAIFCDGTWNQLDAPAPTNIVRLYHAAEAVDESPDGAVQIACYLPGVGTIGASAAQSDGHSLDAAGGGGPLSDTLARYGGGAFGWGLDEKVLDAYRTLIRNYEPGDAIQVFGFSRGAYTARSLVGLIRNCGLPESDIDDRLSLAIEFYRSRAEAHAPDAARMRQIRQWLSPRVATDATDLAMRANPGRCTLLRIEFLGLFDTVGALGVPGILTHLSRVVNRRYAFHDTRLSSMVAAARHAIAIDDRRATYPPTLFDPERLADLNRRAGDAQPYREEWFPGVHGTVGGGLLEKERGLGDATIEWIAEGAAAAGLGFDPAQMAAWKKGIRPGDPLVTEARKPGAVDRLTMSLFPYTRRGVPTTFVPSKVTELRWRMERTGGDWPYRPKSLRERAQTLGWPG